MFVVIPIAITVVIICVIIMNFKAARREKRPDDDREIIIPEQIDSLPNSHDDVNHHHSDFKDSHNHSDSHPSSHDVGGMLMVRKMEYGFYIFQIQHKLTLGSTAKKK